MHSKLTLIVGIALASILAASAPAAATAAEPAFTVRLHEDGSAAVAVTYAFDLDTESERAAFAELRENESARQAYAARYAGRIGSVAANAENATGRAMRVGDATAELSTEGSTGLLTLQATWYGLAATDGEKLVVTEPFASGFEPDRRFLVALPDGYAATAAPSPTASDDGRLYWDAGTDLSGFELTAEPESDGEATNGEARDGATSGFGPGFGAPGAVAALVAVGVLANRLR